MSEGTWRADRFLSAEMARDAIVSQFPQFDGQGIELLGSGWEFDAYAAGNEWVFRFPRRSECVSHLEREIPLLDLVAPVMHPLAVPHVELWGEPGPHFPYRFAAHRMIPGVPADQAAGIDQDKLALDLGAALHRLHSVPPEAADDAGVILAVDDGAQWLARTRAVSPGLHGLGPTVDAALEWLGNVDRASVAYRGPPRLVHNDFCPDHLLVDPSTETLTGIIDWTDAVLGDPVLDFVVLMAWRGDRFVDRVLDAYRLSLDEGFAARLRSATRVRSIYWLHLALEQGGNVDKHREWVENAFA